jgi:flagellar hook assembly protein FlgD
VLDATGRRVRSVLDGWLPAGRHEITWDGRGEAGARVAAGVYFMRIAGPGGSASVRFVEVN